MLQFNLLPDVKKEYIKAKRTKRLIVSTSMLVSGIALAILILLFSYVQIAQRKNIKDLTNDIEKEVASIQSINGLNEILTIQNQLNTIPTLAEERPFTSRLFNHIRAVTPIGVYISNLEVDVINNAMEITGTSDNLALINEFADTLKFATYKAGDSEGKPFSKVLTTLSRKEESSSYVIELEYDPIIFDNTQNVSIIVKNSVTTRSVTGQPNLSKEEDRLFIDSPDNEGEQQ